MEKPNLLVLYNALYTNGKMWNPRNHNFTLYVRNESPENWSENKLKQYVLSLITCNHAWTPEDIKVSAYVHGEQDMYYNENDMMICVSLNK